MDSFYKFAHAKLIYLDFINSLKNIPENLPQTRNALFRPIHFGKTILITYSKTCSCTCFGFFILTHSNKYMIIASAWSQLLFFFFFFSKYIKFQSGKRFGHRCGPSSVPDLFESKNIKESKPL